MENPDAQSSSPQLQLPQLKKPKMSSTTSDEEQDTTTLDDNNIHTNNETEPTKQKRYKRRKIAIFFAYCGVGYQGMQKNPGAKTIEGEMEIALFQAGAVPDHDRCQPRRYGWARSARTDKGVSAVGQVVSGRFYVDPPGLVERLNSILPGQIRIFGFKRTTSSFNSKKFCDRRRYVYLIPVFALDPSRHRDRESVIASLGSGGAELAKCSECSERGRKVEGVMGNNKSYYIESKKTVLESNANYTNGNRSSPNNGNGGVTNAEIKRAVKEEIMISAENGDVEMMSMGNGTVVPELDSKVKEELMDDGMGQIDDDANISVQNESLDVNIRETVKETNPVDRGKGNFTYGEQEKERFNRILNYYVGTHNFHNFTTRTKAEDPAATRYIISFDANTTVTIEGIEFIKCEVVGQSFMLHQIRKMIGLAVAIIRNCAPESLIETAFRKDVNINVPMAPEVGLYLDECFFTSYNQKWKDTHEELSMKDYKEEAEDFKMKYIYSHIASTEHKEGVVALWLHSLNYRNYPDLLFVDSGETVEARDTCKVNAREIPIDSGAVEQKLGGDILEENGGTGEEKDRRTEDLFQGIIS